MLRVIPRWIPALGVEIDPILAAQARVATQRDVLTGCIFDVQLPDRITAIFGNPPFTTAFLDRLLAQFAPKMPDGSRAGMILPAYALQTPSRVCRYNQTWSIYSEMLPRTLFPGLSKPLVFAIFTRDPTPRFNGLRLYVEAKAIAELAERSRNALIEGTGTWREIVMIALRELGGRAHLSDIYERVAGRRPTTSTWWREKIRQTLGRGPFTSKGTGEWSMDAAAAADGCDEVRREPVLRSGPSNMRASVAL